MDVSLICPCYNSLSSLPRLISSFKNQDFQGTKELLFVVDRGKDETESYLQSVQSEEIKVIVNPRRLGIVGSRTLGIERCLGSYIGFVDADDFLESTFLSKMISAMEKEKADACDCSFYVHKKDKKFAYPFRGPEKVLSGAESVRALLKDTSVRGFVWSKLFKREILLGDPKVALPENLSFEDMPFCFMAFSKCSKVVFLKDPLYHYSKENAASFTKSKNPKRARQHLESFAFMKDFAEKTGRQELIEAFLSSKFRASLSLRYDLSLSKKDGLSKEEAKRIRSDLSLLYKKD